MTTNVVRRRGLLIGAAAVAASAGAATVLLAHSAGASDPRAGSAIPFISALSNAPQRAEPGLDHVSRSTGLTSFRVLARGLGRFDSRVVAAPSADGRTVCYALIGATNADPSMSYCYRPVDPGLPPGLAGQHFHAVAPEAVVDRKVGVQLFGVAFNDVKKLRVQVAGSWTNVPLSNNAFYLDLPGIRYEQMGLVEATLANGSTQVEDLQTGT
jgi:hypothetical protein